MTSKTTFLIGGWVAGWQGLPAPYSCQPIFGNNCCSIVNLLHLYGNDNNQYPDYNSRGTCQESCMSDPSSEAPNLTGISSISCLLQKHTSLCQHMLGADISQAVSGVLTQLLHPTAYNCRGSLKEDRTAEYSQGMWKNHTCSTPGQ
jgi:hypothetical protein